MIIYKYFINIKFAQGELKSSVFIYPSASVPSSLFFFLLAIGQVSPDFLGSLFVICFALFVG